MDPIYVPLLSVLAGAIIGSAASVVTIIVQATAENRRQRFRLAMETALAEQRIQFEALKGHDGTLLPISTYISTTFK